MRRWVVLAIGAVLLGVAAIAVKGCGDEEASSSNASIATDDKGGSASGASGKNGTVRDLFGQKPKAKGADAAQVPRVTLNSVGEDVLKSAAYLAVIEVNDREMDYAFLDAEGKRLGKLTTDGMPKAQGSISRDRKWLTFVAMPEIRPQRWDVYVASLDGKSLYLLTEDFPPQSEMTESRDQGKGVRTRFNNRPSFTADGSRIVFTTGLISEPKNFVSMPKAGGPRTFLTKAEGKTEFLKYQNGACSPVGDEIVFSRGVDRTGRVIWKLNVATGDEKVLLAPERGRFDGPRWSPDGSQVACTEVAEAYNKFWIHVMNADGSNDRRLNPGSIESKSFSIDWSSDGSKILFTKVADRQEDIYAIDVTTGAVSRITETTESEIGPLTLR